MPGTYYYYEDAGGANSGGSQGDAYDGTGSGTLPDASSGTTNLKNVITALKSGDILYIKRNDDGSDISIASTTQLTLRSTDGPTRFDDGGTSYGPTTIIGYDTDINTIPSVDRRPQVALGAGFLKWARGSGLIENVNFTGHYSGNAILQIQTGSMIRRCRVIRNDTNAGAAIIATSNSTIDSCEVISLETKTVETNPGSNTGFVVGLTDSSIINSVVESVNGVSGIVAKQADVGAILVLNSIIKTNYFTSYGMLFQSGAYMRGTYIIGNIFDGNGVTGGAGVYLNAGDGSKNQGCPDFHNNIFLDYPTGITADDFFNLPIPSDTSTTPNTKGTSVSMGNFYHNCGVNSSFNREMDGTTLDIDPVPSRNTGDYTIVRNSSFGTAATQVQFKFGEVKGQSLFSRGVSGSNTTLPFLRVKGENSSTF